MSELEPVLGLDPGQLYRLAPIALSLIDLSGAQIDANDAYLDLFGLRRDELTGIDAESITHPEDRERTRAYLEDLIAGRVERIELDKRYVRADGTTFVGRLRAVALRDDRGEVMALCGAIVDITAEHRQRLELEHTERRMAALLANINDSVTVVDRNGIVIDGTGFFDNILGYESGFWAGRSVWELTDPDELERLSARYDEVLANPGLRVQFDMRLRTAEGDWQVIELSAVNLLDDEHVGGIVLTTRNITDRKALEAELADERDLAVEEARLRTEFTMRASHELRNQIHALGGLSELVASAGVPEATRDLAAQAVRTAGRLQRLVDNVLDFSRYRGTTPVAQPRSTLISHLVDDVTAIGRSLATDGVEVRAVVHPDVPESVLVDESMVAQALGNLIGNAAKFTESGYIELGVEPGHGGDPPTLRWTVTDTGRGVPVGDRERIFRAFEQVERDDRDEGLGLGLSITAQLAEVLGGSVWLSDEPASGSGSGSSFTVELPFHPDPVPSSGSLAEQRTTTATEDLSERRVGQRRTRERRVRVHTSDVAAPPGSVRHGDPDRRDDHLGADGEEPAEPRARVLVVEDNAVNQLLVKEQLKRLGMAVTVVANGTEAIDAAGGGASFDLVLMDWQLPEVDGVEATRRIRAAEPPGHHLPIIGMTASAQVSDRRTCLEAGMDDVLVKPTSFEELREAVEAYVREPTCTNGSGADAIGPALDDLAGDLGSAEPVRTIVATYLEELETRRTAVREAIEEGDAERLHRTAHSLRATSRTLGARRVDELAAALEGIELPPGAELLAEFDDAADEAAGALADWLERSAS